MVVITDVEDMDNAIATRNSTMQYQSPLLRQFDYWYGMKSDAFNSANTTLERSRLGGGGMSSVEEWTWAPVAVMSDGGTIPRTSDSSTGSIGAVQYFRETDPPRDTDIHEGRIFLSDDDDQV